MSGASSPADAPAVTVGWHCVSEHRRLPVSVGYGQCSAGLAPVERAGPSCEEELTPAVRRPGPLLVTASGSTTETKFSLIRWLRTWRRWTRWHPASSATG